MSQMNRKRRLRAVPGIDPGGADLSGTDRDARAADDKARENDALHRAGRGDETAFAEFYDALSGLVYGVVLRVVRDPAMSEEVAQEVFLEIWRLAPRYDREKGSAKTWAATIAHRRAVDRVRSEESRRQRDERELQLVDEPRDVVIEAIDAREETEQVRVALSLLTEGQREAVTLAYYGGHTYRAVAALLDVPEGTIKTRIRDGLIRLRDHLEVTQ